MVIINDGFFIHSEVDDQETMSGSCMAPRNRHTELFSFCFIGKILSVKFDVVTISHPKER